MSFTTDKQTLYDLNLLGKFNKNSIINIYNRTVTGKGERILEMMFLTPLNEAGEINERSSVFRYFQKNNINFPISVELMDEVESYLSSFGAENKLESVFNVTKYKVRRIILGDDYYDKIESGLLALIKMLNELYTFVNQLPEEDNYYRQTIDQISDIFEDEGIKWIREVPEKKSGLSFIQMSQYDYKFRYKYASQLDKILNFIYEIDVYTSVAQTAIERNFIYAEALTGKINEIKIEGVYHPAIKKAIANKIALDTDKNVFFLTGANMAGKSTFMKSCSIALYLAHMGFPVPAKKMEFSPMDGIYTSINVPDDINRGYSHFYAEVLRVKNIAIEVGKGKRLFVIFDELFKGTNVKDAYDGTVAVTEAFGGNRQCSFIISTHIIEVGDALKDLKQNNVQFYYFPTLMDGMIPRYTYTLQEGITEDRHGMLIINNEGIVDIIKGQVKA